jgi:uncharacterized protein (DUF2062 family)
LSRISRRLAASLAGSSAETIARILAVGLVLGTFPIYGCPTILCVLASLILGINLPALQLVNQLATPLQLAMLVPFVRLGARILYSPSLYSTRPAASFAWGLGASALQAVAGWLCVCLPLGVLLYFTLTCVLDRFPRGWRTGCLPVCPESRTPRNYEFRQPAPGNG